MGIKELKKKQECVFFHHGENAPILFSAMSLYHYLRHTVHAHSNIHKLQTSTYVKVWWQLTWIALYLRKRRKEI